MDVFHSKIDGWLLLVLIFAILASLYSAYSSVSSGHIGHVITGVVVLLIGAGLPLWILLSTKYVVSADTLSIYSGPFRWKIKKETIEAITPSNNPISSPALSLNRLQIRYAKGRSILVSPADQAGFCQSLGFSTCL